MQLFKFERRWSRLVAQAQFADASIGPVHDKSLEELIRFLEAGTAPSRWAFRLGLLMIALAPLWHWRRPCSLSALPLDERATLLNELLNHSWYPVRELTFMIKVSLTMLLVGDSKVRSSTHYDDVTWEAEPVTQSGERTRLPIQSDESEVA